MRKSRTAGVARRFAPCEQSTWPTTHRGRDTADHGHCAKGRDQALLRSTIVPMRWPLLSTHRASKCAVGSRRGATKTQAEDTALPCRLDFNGQPFDTCRHASERRCHSNTQPRMVEDPDGMNIGVWIPWRVLGPESPRVPHPPADLNTLFVCHSRWSTPQTFSGVALPRATSSCSASPPPPPPPWCRAGTSTRRSAAR